MLVLWLRGNNLNVIASLLNISYELARKRMQFIRRELREFIDERDRKDVNGRDRRPGAR
jgi:hypothetical protein